MTRRELAITGRLALTCCVSKGRILLFQYMGYFKKPGQQSLMRASSCQCLQTPSGSHVRARFPNIFWKLLFLPCYQLVHWESSMSAALRKEKFEQTLQGERPAHRGSKCKDRVSCFAVSLPSQSFPHQFPPQTNLQMPLLSLRIYAFACFVCPAEHHQYETYFPSPWLWEEPLTWRFSWDDGSRKKA